MFKTFQQDPYFRYLRKDQGIPSTFGKKKCFLDRFAKQKKNIFADIWAYQLEFFGKEQEYGLVNRLDNDTAWLLYFAKTPLFYTRYKQLQEEHKLQKIYVADVFWKRIPDKVLWQPGISGTKAAIAIDRLIANHKHEEDRVVVIADKKRRYTYRWKIRGELHEQHTEVELIHYDKKTNTSSLKVTITKGFRHQIRAHLASLGYPILGDKLYNKKNPKGELHLWSVGLVAE